MTHRGWILRNTIVWHKKNCMPCSAKDRFTADFENLYFFTLNPRYYFKQQFERYEEPINRWGGPVLKKVDGKKKEYNKMQKVGSTSVLREGGNMRPNPLGRNKRCVWKIPTQPFPEAHFAVFPEITNRDSAEGRMPQRWNCA